MNAVLQQAARWRGQRVGLYGGSFNPAHEGHAHIALTALKRLSIDALWVLASPGNPLKKMADMADYSARTRSVQSVIGQHPKIHYSDLEEKLGTRYSIDLLRKLQKTMPTTEFIWIMGADNLLNFPRWHRYREIMERVPVAIFDRPGYSIEGLNSDFARQYRRYRLSLAQFNQASAPAWTFVTLQRNPGSATDIRKNADQEWWRTR